MALGARPRHIGRLFGSEALVMSAIGIALGLGAALAAGPAIRSLLYGISPEDPASLAAAALFVVLVAAMGTAGPARRAVLIDPAAALRQDN
jgi:ABC-type antimicrobial peptide transport system permease subunit